LKKKILIVEDKTDTRWWEKAALEIAGFEVLEAGDAKEGINLAIKQKPDLVLMDIRLPYKKRGIGAAKILRNTKETRDIPIIFITGYSEFKESKEVKNITNCSYLIKPIKIDALVKSIKQHIK